MSKAHFVEYVGRYIRRPPVAEHRLTRETEESVQYIDWRCGLRHGGTRHRLLPRPRRTRDFGGYSQRPDAFPYRPDRSLCASLDRRPDSRNTGIRSSVHDHFLTKSALCSEVSSMSQLYGCRKPTLISAAGGSCGTPFLLSSAGEASALCSRHRFSKGQALP